MKNLLLILIMIAGYHASSQNSPSLILTADSDLLLNGQPVNNQTSLSAIVKILGEPELAKQHKSGKTSYMYSKSGLVFDVYNNKLVMIGANFNWDGDKSFPQTSFIGDFLLGSTAITKSSTNSVLSEIKFMTFNELIDNMYIGGGENKKVAVTVAFRDGPITQMTFSFRPTE